jgi:hypothetical protein
MWFARTNQGCLVAIGLGGAILGLVQAAGAIFAGGLEKAMTLAVGAGVFAAGVVVVRLSVQRRTFDLLRKSWLTFLDFTGI